MVTRHDDPVTYTGGDGRIRAPHVLPSKAMRSASAVLLFFRLCGVTGLGVYLGGAVAGLIAVITGDVFASGSPWPRTAPALAIAGAGVGLALGWLTRRWLLPQAAHRWLTFTLTGIATLPLFAAVAQLRAIETVGIPLVVAGAIAVAIVYWRASRRSSRSVPGSFARSAGR